MPKTREDAPMSIAEGPINLDTPEGPAPKRLPSRRRVLAASMFTVGYAAAIRPVNAQAITTDAAGLTIEEVKIPAFGGYALPAYVARPAGKTKAPAVIVVNEIFGVHAYIKDVCRRLAKLGYLAVAPDYFDRAGDPSVLSDMAAIRPIVEKAGQQQVLGDTGAIVAWLQKHKAADAQKIGITGFCWGGNVVWMAAAKTPGIKAGVAWYGRLKKPAQPMFSGAADQFPLDVVGEIKAPVLGLYGGKDQGIPVADVEAMRAALAAAGNPQKCEIVLYPEAQHGFHADFRPSYDKSSAMDGWARLEAWFKTHGVV
ncbi:MAG: dienelactone hydrolase family protein [Hyphomonadaceae bacterium]